MTPDCAREHIVLHRRRSGAFSVHDYLLRVREPNPPLAIGSNRAFLCRESLPTNQPPPPSQIRCVHFGLTSGWTREKSDSAIIS